MRFIRLTLTCAAILLATMGHAHASMLTGAFQSQLEAWLGPGASIDGSALFSKITGDGQTSVDFHAAVDGKGATIVLIEVLYNFTDGYDPYDPPRIIGGFNPQSWHTSGYNLTPDDEDRTAFIFNLTDGIFQPQRLNNDPFGPSFGETQTYNNIDFGPVFGLGNDIIVMGDLLHGTLTQTSYGGGDYPDLNPNLLGNTQPSSDIEIGRIGVYSVSFNATPVPEPGSLALCGMGALGLVFGGFRRHRMAQSVLSI